MAEVKDLPKPFAISEEFHRRREEASDILLEKNKSSAPSSTATTTTKVTSEFYDLDTFPFKDYACWFNFNMTATSSEKQKSATKTAIQPTRGENYPEWYQQVIRGADMAENSGVRGCMVIKPWGYGIWEQLVADLDRRIKETGHENCYFPLFIPLSLIQKEAEHVAGFAKEMAIVTHHRLAQKEGKLELEGELEEPLVIRPTSETIIGEAFAKWVKSYRDLPVLINQWANVVRWEMRPRMFLRTAEFLWQEGHTAHATAEEAMKETLTMLEVYRSMAEEHLALPVICGEKTPGERFPGAVGTYCIEAMMQDGKALQAGTSHFLGQNFAKAADIRFQTKESTFDFAYTTSWGVTTRLIGAIIMSHGDDDGLRLPPRLAPQQIVIVPILRDDNDHSAVLKYADDLAALLRQKFYGTGPVRVKVDRRDMPSADKRWDWIRKGVPLICEVGPKDMANQSVAMVRRDRLKDPKRFIPIQQFADQVADELKEVHQTLYNDALANREKRTRRDITNLKDFQEYFKASGDQSYAAGQGFVHGPWCGDEAAVMPILKELGVTIRCQPFEQKQATGTCILTGRPAVAEAIFARSY